MCRGHQISLRPEGRTHARPEFRFTLVARIIEYGARQTPMLGRRGFCFWFGRATGRGSQTDQVAHPSRAVLSGV